MDLGPLNMNYGISEVSYVTGETQQTLPAGIIRPSDEKVEDALDYVLPKKTVETQILKVLTPAVDGSRTLPNEYDAAFDAFSKALDSPEIHEKLLDDDGDDWLIREVKAGVREQRENFDILSMGMNALYQA
jgi:hypothetical protein